MRLPLFAATIAVVSSASAWACDAPASNITFVGTLNGQRVLVREIDDQQNFLSLYILDLAKNETRLFATILDGNEKPEEKEKIRARRWKKAQADLEKQGLALQTFDFKRLPVTVGEVELRTSKGSKDNGCMSVTLDAVKGKASRTLAETGYCGSSDTSDFSGVAFTPDGLYVLPVIQSGCPDSPEQWVKAFPIATLLDAPAKKGMKK